MKILCFLAGLFLLACNPPGAPVPSAAGAGNDGQEQAATQASYVDLSPREFATYLGQPNTVLIDVRTPGEIAGGKIEGAVELDFRGPDFADRLAAIDADKTILVYCASGGRSARAAGMLTAGGARRVYNLKGGYGAWAKQ